MGPMHRTWQSRWSPVAGSAYRKTWGTGRAACQSQEIRSLKNTRRASLARPHPSGPEMAATRRYTSPLKWPTRLITLALARRRAEAATSAHALPEFFALLGRHVLPPLCHATAKVGAVEPAATKTAEEDP